MNKKLLLLLVGLVLIGVAVQTFGAKPDNGPVESGNSAIVEDSTVAADAGPAVTDPSKGGGVDKIPDANAAATFSLPLLATYTSANYVADGIGLRNTGRGTINLRVPEGSTPMAAWLYWTILRPTAGAHDNEITVNGIKVFGSLIGSGPDPCWGQTTGRTYRASVLSALQQTDANIRGGAYGITIGGVSSGLTNGQDPFVSSVSPLAENAAIVLVYNTGNPANWVKIYNGYYEQSGGLATTAIPAGALKYTSITADGQANLGSTTTYGKYVNFNVFQLQKGTLNGVDPSLTSRGTIKGALADTDTFVLPSAALTGAALNYNLVGDCIAWNALVYSNTAT